VQALDARTGDLVWENRLGPFAAPGLNATRTMALYGNLLFYPATDARMYALDARTGKIVWQIAVSENPDDKIGGIMVARDKLLVGLTRCDELDARDHCFIAGYDAKRRSDPRGQHALHRRILYRFVGSSDESTPFIEHGPWNSR